jgi:CheY-like chemotaxis protein
MTSILLIDDDLDLTGLYTELLEQLGHLVTSAPNGQAGLALARELQPDLIITDVSMPLMNGLELCRRLRSDASLRAVPLIIHSSEVDLLIPRGEVFLPKPCELWDFIALVNQLLTNARAGQELASTA